MGNIQMVDLKSQYLRIKHEVDQGIQQVIDSGAFINGEIVHDFANELAAYLNCKHVVPCANGTDALQIAMMALGLVPGDEVILPVHTYVATAEVIALLHLVPVFVDVEEDTFLIDVNQVESRITKKTKAVVPVHLYGQCADMEKLLELRRKHGFYIIEDTAQALGAEYIYSNGTSQKAGTIGDIGCTSFFPSKNLGCFGDGGAMMINNNELAKKAKMIASHGQSVKYHHDVVGCNSRLDTIQAAVLNVKLPLLDRYNRSRLEVANKYDAAFKDVEQLQIPVRAPNSSHVFHQYTLKVYGINRDLLKEGLEQHGIPSMIYYPIPLHLQKAFFQVENGLGTYPVTENLSKTVLSLPIHTEMVEDEQLYIINTLKEIIEKL